MFPDKLVVGDKAGHDPCIKCSIEKSLVEVKLQTVGLPRGMSICGHPIYLLWIIIKT